MSNDEKNNDQFVENDGVLKIDTPNANESSADSSTNEQDREVQASENSSEQSSEAYASENSSEQNNEAYASENLNEQNSEAYASESSDAQSNQMYANDDNYMQSDEGYADEISNEQKPVSKKTAYILIPLVLAILTVAIILTVVLVKRNNEEETDDGFHTATATLVPTGSASVTQPADTTDTDTAVTPEPTSAPNIQVTLGQYKGIEVTKDVAEVTDADIQEELDYLQSIYTETEAVLDRTEVREGDVLLIDYTGTMDGVVFEGGSATDTELKIGSNHFIPGFESGLVGKQVGDVVILDINFPDPYLNNTDLSGKPVTFTVTIKAISVEVVPEITDEFIKEKEGYDTVEAYKESVRQSLMENNEADAENRAYNEVLNIAINNATYEGELAAAYSIQAADVSNYYENIAYGYYGVDAKTLFAQMYGFDEETYNNFINDTAISAVKQIYLLEAVVKEEGLTLTEEEYATGLQNFMTSYSIATEEEFYAQVTREQVENELLSQKARDLILESAILK